MITAILRSSFFFLIIIIISIMMFVWAHYTNIYAYTYIYLYKYTKFLLILHLSIVLRVLNQQSIYFSLTPSSIILHTMCKVPNCRNRRRKKKNLHTRIKATHRKCRRRNKQKSIHRKHTFNIYKLLFTIQFRFSCCCGFGQIMMMFDVLPATLLFHRISLFNIAITDA